MEEVVSTFTLDTNCIIDMEEDRPNAVFVKKIVKAAKAGKAKVSILASSASERQIGGNQYENIAQFKDRLHKIGLDHLELLKPIGKYDLSFWDFAVTPNEKQQQREQEIFECLFPQWPFRWQAFAEENKIDPENLVQGKAWKWRNILCDAQHYWSHEESGNQHFVTSDMNFKKKLTPEAGFPNASILSPEEASQIVK